MNELQPVTVSRRRSSLPMVIIIGLLLAALGIIWFIIHVVLVQKQDYFDTRIIVYLSAHISSRMTGFMVNITFLGSRYFLFTAYLVIICWFIFFQKKRRMALNVAIVGAIGVALVTILKNLFQRPRPLNPMFIPLDTYSFPSGHTTAGFIFYGLLIYLVWKGKQSRVLKYLLSALLILISVLIGISRIYLGMHFPSDVVAGFCLGYAWLSVAILILEKLNKKQLPEELKVV